MTQQPREFDAVLGGQSKIPLNAAVLGGIEGVKMRLASDKESVRIAAIEEAMKYGEAGLEEAIAFFNKSPQLQQTVLKLIREKQNEAPIKDSYFFQRTITTRFPSHKFIDERFVNKTLIRIYRGDITNLKVDVIVSSDDTRLKMGGGVSHRIKAVGGAEIYRQTRQIAPIGLGQIAVTDAGNLLAKKVFHAAVLDWSKKKNSSLDVVKQVIRNCTIAACQYNMESIAIPLLGTGAGRLDPVMVWKAILSQLEKELSQKELTVKEVAIAILGVPSTGLNLENLF